MFSLDKSHFIAWYFSKTQANADFILGHRLQRWPTINSALVQCLVIARGLVWLVITGRPVGGTTVRYIAILSTCFNSILFQCWVNVVDCGLTISHHWTNVLCLLGCAATACLLISQRIIPVDLAKSEKMLLIIKYLPLNISFHNTYCLVCFPRF